MSKANEIPNFNLVLVEILVDNLNKDIILWIGTTFFLKSAYFFQVFSVKLCVMVYSNTLITLIIKNTMTLQEHLTKLLHTILQKIHCKNDPLLIIDYNKI